MEWGSGGERAVERGLKAWARACNGRSTCPSLFCKPAHLPLAPGVDLFPSWRIGENSKNDPASGLAPGDSVLASGRGLGPKAICKMICWGFFARGWESLPGGLGSWVCNFHACWPVAGGGK